MEKLSGGDYQALTDALCAAFPDPAALRRMLRFRRGLNLDVVTGEGALVDRVFALIGRAEAEGWTLELVRGALAENPGNPALAAVASRLLPAAERPAAKGSPPSPSPPTAAAAPGLTALPREPRVGALRWLHLSDLHLGSEDGYGHDIVLQALVAAFRDGGTLAARRPDVVFCTGDVAQSGRKEQYGAAGRFFDALSGATGVPFERIFVVPGNHDLDRDLVSRSFVLPLESREQADAFFGDAGTRDRRFAFERFEAYAEFQQSRFSLPLSAARPFVLTRCRVGAEVVGVIGLNTAWLAHQDDGQGKLVVGERLVRQALKELDEADEPATVRVALLHHPLDWLRDFERDSVKGLLLESVDYILHGHLHTQRPEVVRGPEGDAVVLAAGAAYQGRKWPASALLVELAANEARVEAICFREHGKGVWMRDEILAPRSGGVFRIPRRAAAVVVEEPPPSRGAEDDTSAAG
jgi:calcineurin-like phosphoesterase family protein